MTRSFIWLSLAAVLGLTGLAGCDRERADDLGGGTSLVYLVEDVPAGLDYDGPAATLPTSQIGIVNLMDPLVEYAATDKVKNGIRQLDFTRFEGRLAKSWSFDEERLVWTLNLREGVVSCTGNELTADDVIYSFARARSVSGSAPIGWFISSVASIDGFTNEVLTDEGARDLGDEVRKVDRYTVEIRQSGPNRLFLHAMTTFGFRVFDSKEVKLHATAHDPWSHDYVNNVTAPGFGPYCLERWSKGNEFVLTANPDYYRGSPAIEREVFKRVPQSSNRFIIMRMEEADLADRLTPREFLRLKDYGHLKVVGITGNETLFVHMNFRTPPFDNILIRKAIAAALPYDWIIENGYFGQARKWNALAPTRYPGADTLFEGPDTGIERARDLLAQAGYPGGRGLEKYADAFRLAYVAEKESVLGPIATAMRTALREAGFPVELDPIPLTQYGDRQLVKKDLGFALNDQEKPAVVDAGYAVQLFFASPAAGGVNNMVNYHSEKVDALWARARTEIDPDKRAELLTGIYRQLSRDIAWLPVVEYETQWVATKTLEGFTWYPDNALRFADLRWAQ